MFNAIFMLGNEDARVQNQHVECRGSITKFRGTYNDEFEALALQSTLLYVYNNIRKNDTGLTGTMH